MKKAIISGVSIILILAAIFLALFVAPQFMGKDYYIKTLPDKLEYKLILKDDGVGGTFLEKDEKWNMTGLVVAKKNVMGQSVSLDSKDYSLVFPSLSAGAGDYEVKIIITKTEEELVFSIKIVMAQ